MEFILKRRPVYTQEVGRNMIFFYSIDPLVFTKLARYLKNRERWPFSSQKNDHFNMGYHVYWIRKTSCFELFVDGKYGVFWPKKLMCDYLFFSMEHYVYWLLKCFCFEILGDGKYGIFFVQKFDGKMIFASYFWTFYDIPGLGKISFWCSALSHKFCLIHTRYVSFRFFKCRNKQDF